MEVAELEVPVAMLVAALPIPSAALMAAVFTPVVSAFASPPRVALAVAVVFTAFAAATVVARPLRFPGGTAAAGISIWHSAGNLGIARDGEHVAVGAHRAGLGGVARGAFGEPGTAGRDLPGHGPGVRTVGGRGGGVAADHAL